MFLLIYLYYHSLVGEYFLEDFELQRQFYEPIYLNLNPDFSTIYEKRTSGGDRMIIKFFKMYSIDSAYSLLEEIIKN